MTITLDNLLFDDLLITICYLTQISQITRNFYHFVFSARRIRRNLAEDAWLRARLPPGCIQLTIDKWQWTSIGQLRCTITLTMTLTIYKITLFAISETTFFAFCPCLVKNRRCDSKKSQVWFLKKAGAIFRNRRFDIFSRRSRRLTPFTDLPICFLYIVYIKINNYLNKIFLINYLI